MPIQTDLGYELLLKDEGAIQLLRLRANGEPLPLPNYNIIDKDDLYSKEPWEVFGDDHKWHTIKKKGGCTTSITYVFTKVNKVRPNSKNMSKVRHNSNNMSRAAGKGTWRLEKSNYDRISASGETFGLMIMLSFRNKDSPNATTGWNMHEYSLRRESPSKLSGAGIYDNDWVLCKITRRVKDSPQAQEQSSSTNKRAAEEVVPPAVQACCSYNKMQKMCVVGSAAEVPPTPTIASAAISNKDHISSLVAHQNIQQPCGDGHVSSLVAHQNIQQPCSDGHVSSLVAQPHDENIQQLFGDIPENLLSDEIINELKSLLGNLPEDQCLEGVM